MSGKLVEKENTGCAIVLTTTDDMEVAASLATYLVESGLAACVQVDETVGFFKWEGKFSQGKEFRLMIKISADKYKSVEEAIVARHNYTLPQIVKLDIAGGLVEYLEWVRHPEHDFRKIEI